MKRILRLIFLLLLIISLLNACGGSKNANSSSPQEANQSKDEKLDGSLEASLTDDKSSGEAKTEGNIDKGKIDPSLPLLVLNKGEEAENDKIQVKFIDYKIIDIPQLREGIYADKDPSESYHLELQFEITSKDSPPAKNTMLDININETIFVEYKYSFSKINPVVHYVYAVKFQKSDNVVLDPTTIETVRFHHIIYDENKTDYKEDPYYEGYIVFNIT